MCTSKCHRRCTAEFAKRTAGSEDKDLAVRGQRCQMAVEIGDIELRCGCLEAVKNAMI